MGNEIKSILELDDLQCEILIRTLNELDDTTRAKVTYVKNNTEATIQEALEYVVLESPLLWAKVYLDWEGRDYQKEMLKQGKLSKKLVLRLGRRLGKTECMCILILWHAFTQINKGPNAQYDILIFGPYETQVDLIFKRLKQLIEGSPLLMDEISRDIQHHLELKNGTVIAGLTAGASNGSGGSNNSRGQRADLLVMDECDYIGSNNITNIINITNEAPERIKIMAASTPSGKHEEYYGWCTNASRRYYPSKEDIEQFKFSDYLTDTNAKGNGWCEIYAPSIVNKELLKVNSDTKRTYLEDLQHELTEMRFIQEVMAEFGEEEMGVYQRKYIECAIDEGKRINYQYMDNLSREEIEKYVNKTKFNIKMLGCDWDKYGANTNIVAVELDRLHLNKEGIVEPMFKILFRIEIPRSQFTYVNAVNRIVELNDLWQFDHIAVDRGYGETQIELLHKYGLENPESGLSEKVRGYHFSEKIKVHDPYTMKKDMKHLKPFMVNNSVRVFENKKIILQPDDKDFTEQLGAYVIKSRTTTGMPVFSDENEHAIDALNLCLLAFEQNHSYLFKQVLSHSIKTISGFKTNDVGKVKTRYAESKSVAPIANIGSKQVINVYSTKKKRPSVVTRRSF